MADWAVLQVIKKHLHAKAFHGEISNAVKSQIWIAICTYVLIAIIRKKLMLNRSLYEILQILTISQFEKTPLLSLFTSFDYKTTTPVDCNQPKLFDLWMDTSDVHSLIPTHAIRGHVNNWFCWKTLVTPIDAIKNEGALPVFMGFSAESTITTWPV